MTFAEADTRKLSVEQVSIMVERSERTVFRWLRSGKLPSLEPGDVALFLREMWAKQYKAKPRGRPFRAGSSY